MGSKSITDFARSITGIVTIMKPNGLDIFLNVTKPSHVEDIIWEAVREAFLAGWTPKQFKNELAQAWEYELKKEIELAHKTFT